jgi:MFS superfamily sulfate permease-like transporter
VFIKRTSNEQINVNVFRNHKFVSKSSLGKHIQHQEPDATLVVKFSGQINYLNSDNYYQQLLHIDQCKIIIFSFSQTSDLDMDGIKALEASLEYFLSKHIDVYLTGIGSKRMQRLSAHLPVVKKLVHEKKLYASTSELLDVLGC